MKITDMNRWTIYLNGNAIDAVYYFADMTKEEVKESLVKYDGFDPKIELEISEKPLDSAQ